MAPRSNCNSSLPIFVIDEEFPTAENGGTLDTRLMTSGQMKGS
jgi:hypothetical protein